MRIERAELHELTLPLVEPFIISGGAMTVRRSLVVVLHDDEGHVGYGEAPPFELPFYSEETVASARDVIARVLLPRVRGRTLESSTKTAGRPWRATCAARDWANAPGVRRTSGLRRRTVKRWL